MESSEHFDTEKEKRQTRESVTPNRRNFLLALASFAVIGSASGKVEAKKESSKEGGQGEVYAKELMKRAWGDAELPSSFVQPHHEGQYIFVRDILKQGVPEPNWQSFLGEEGTGLIISKKYHEFWLYKDGKLIGHDVIGSAKTSQGHDTPIGEFTIVPNGKRGSDFVSTEFPGAKMSWASFLNIRDKKGNLRGIAVHGSANFEVWPGDVRVVKIDNSGGCLNLVDEYAKLVQDTLQEGRDKVVILP